MAALSVVADESSNTLLKAYLACSALGSGVAFSDLELSCAIPFSYPIALDRFAYAYDSMSACYLLRARLLAYFG